jgi:polysaccharide pyruvyl transferase WcaK-like protein
MKHVCLWGTSLGKVADEAQFLALLQMLEEVAPGAAVTILARPHPESIIGRTKKTVHVVPTADLFAVARKLARADAIVMVGGCFMESPRQAMACAVLTIIARACRTPIVGIGVTAFPYRHVWARQIYRRVFNAMKAITVREPSAQRALADLDIRTQVVREADPRYVLSPATADGSDGLLERLGLSAKRPIICVTLRHLHDAMPDWVKVSHGYSTAAVDKANGAIGQALDRLSAEAQLVLLPMHPSLEDDMSAAIAIKTRMRDPAALRTDLPQLRAPELLTLISRSDLVVASRLAAGIFSISTATPILAIAYENRLVDLMAELKLDAFVMPWLEVDSGRFEAAAERAWTERQQIRKVMQSSTRPLVQSAWANAEIIARHVA